MSEGEISTDIYDGAMRHYGRLPDLVRVRDTSISATAAPLTTITPDFDPTHAGATLDRPPRAMLNLDEGYVTQTAYQPLRPREHTRVNETFVDSEESEDPTFNTAAVGAIARLQDVFRISVALATPPTPSIFNDLFGTSPSDSLVKFGRLEIRISTHFYKDDETTGPLFFASYGVRDDGLGSPAALLMDPDDFTAGTDLKGEYLSGHIGYHTLLRSFIPVAGIPKGTCELPDLSKSTTDTTTPAADVDVIDDRIFVISGFTCPDVTDPLETICRKDVSCGPIDCAEIGSADLQERWTIVVDGINCLMYEIDRLWCAIKHIEESLDGLAVAGPGDTAFVPDLCAPDG